MKCLLLRTKFLTTTGWSCCVEKFRDEKEVVFFEKNFRISQKKKNNKKLNDQKKLGSRARVNLDSFKILSAVLSSFLPAHESLQWIFQPGTIFNIFQIAPNISGKAASIWLFIGDYSYSKFLKTRQMIPIMREFSYNISLKHFFFYIPSGRGMADIVVSFIEI